jgi:uncharacterized protein YoxC/predicted nucleic-acid-binding Zn-ribbon protein
MAVLKCHQCGYTKGVADQYIGKAVKCPECGQATKIYDTALLLTLYSKKVLEVQTELKEVKEVMASYQTYTTQPAVPVQNSEEQSQVLNKLFRENRIAMTEFHDATKLRNSMMSRIEQASSHLMRFSIVGFLIILLLLGLFMMQVSSKTDNLSNQLAVIGGGIQASTQELQSIKNVASSLNMNTDDSSDPQTVESIQSVQTEIEKLNQEISRLNKKLKTLSDKYNSLYYPYR